MKWLTCLLIFALGCAPKASELNRNFQINDNGVYGGKKATAEDSFSQSIVGIMDKTSAAICSGTLISSDLVLTAAHCVPGDGKNLEVHFERMMEPLLDRTAPVLQSAKHEAYHDSDFSNDWNDIALLYIDKNKVPADYKPMRVLKNASILKRNSKIIAAGYGIKDPYKESGSGVLRWTVLPILDPEYSDTEISVNQSFEKGLCVGDSGGPTILRSKESEDLLVGVTSRAHGLQFHSCAFYSVMTRVDLKLEWIQEQAQRLRATGQ